MSVTKTLILENMKIVKSAVTITPETAVSFGDWAYLAIAKHSKKIEKHEVQVLEDKDPEDLHQMRVGMRRLRSAIAGFSAALKLPQNASEKKVGKVAKVLGELRDLDVLKDILENQYYPLLPPPEQLLLSLALEKLHKQRKRTFKKVKGLLTDRPYCHLKQGFKHWLENPTFQPIAGLEIQTILPDLLLPQVSHLLLHSGWLVGKENISSLSESQVESILNNQETLLHDLRKEAKRSRYNMELFTQFYEDNYQQYLRYVQEIQSILGEIQDSFILGEFLFQALDFDLPKKMPTLVAKLSEIRWQKWQEWQTLQQVFLDPQTRQELHQTILKFN